MRRSLLVTGASGFIGRRFLARMDAERYERVYCLTRSPTPELSSQAPLRVLHGGLEDESVYASCLAEVETVVHLAAVTGKAPRERYYSVNTEGTRRLVERCREAGVPGFLHVSTIAVGFADQSRYDYARSKELAEKIVSASGLRFAIVRPTLVIGRESGVWKSLRQLVRGPAPVVFGDGRTRVQPIYVDDLVDTLGFLLTHDLFAGNEVFEIGGPEQVTFEDLVRRMHGAFSGRPAARVVHVPLAPVVRVLALLGPLGERFLPVNAGQLAVFANDGTARHSEQLQPRVASMKGLSEMLALVAASEVGAPATRKRETDDALTSECQVFCRYLIRQSPSDYVVRKYAQAHHRRDGFNSDPADRFGRVLLRIARAHPLLTRLADGYAAWCARKSVLRQKLVLLTAILETCAPSYAEFDLAARQRWGTLLRQAIVQGASAVGLLAVAVVVLLPLQLVFGVAAWRKR